MTRDDILAMAREAGFVFIEQRDGSVLPEHSTLIESFAALVAAAEREACANVCEDHSWEVDIDWWIDATKKAVSVKSALECAEAIRARGEKGQS